MGLITFKVFYSAIDAHLTKSKLEDEGVDCILIDEISSSMYPVFTAAGGGIKLQIEEQNLQTATLILKDIEEQPYTDENNIPLICPNCQSTEILSGINSIKGIRGILAMISVFILGILMVPQKTVYKCRSCNNEFNIK